MEILRDFLRVQLKKNSNPFSKKNSQVQYQDWTFLIRAIIASWTTRNVWILFSPSTTEKYVALFRCFVWNFMHAKQTFFSPSTCDLCCKGVEGDEPECDAGHLTTRPRGWTCRNSTSNYIDFKTHSGYKLRWNE